MSACQHLTYLAPWDCGTEDEPDLAVWAMCGASDEKSCGYREKHSHVLKGVETQTPDDWGLGSDEMAEYVENHRRHSEAP